MKTDIPTANPLPDTRFINPDLFPFESRFMEVGGRRMHYIDEGDGVPVLFSHGTPEWSFAWRDLVRGLRGSFRCVAPDLLGFGLSDKPADGDYRVEAHAARMEEFIEKAGLRDFHLVANDFGVGIALAYAIKYPERVRSVSLFNGWMRPLTDDRHYALPARLMYNRLGRWLYQRLNFPVNTIMPAAFGDKSKLTPEVHRHYKMALPTPESRHAAYKFSNELLDAGPFWHGLWQKVDRLRALPVLIFWGMRDTFVPPAELDRWIGALPHARVIRLENAGHFVQEEEPERMVEELREFWSTLPG
jgi:pimeloyl-ACP methyl ester carboxylesterase